MAVVEVDRGDAQGGQALVARCLYVLRVRAERVSPVGATLERKLGTEEDVVASARPRQPLAHEVLRVAVDIGQVPEAQAGGVRVVQEGQLLVPGPRWSVESAEAPEAEADWGHGRAVSAEGS